jgi:diguanylate cyclase (GGDEF)-like protein/PAS domain S-box-containing protein
MSYSDRDHLFYSGRETILVVDDEPLNIRTLSSLLKERFSIKISKSGSEALRILESEKVDLILLDIMMPEMDGFEVAKRVKSSPNTHHIPIIFITAKRDHQTVIDGLKLGAVDFISKPFSREELLVRVETHTALHSLQNRLNLALQDAKLQLQLIDQYISYSKTDLNGYIKDVSTAFTKSTGYLRDELINKNHNIIRSGKTPKSLFADMWATIIDNNTWSGEIVNRKKDGSIYYINSKISPEFDRDGNKVGYVGFYEDITDKKLIETLAQQDFLTKLFNRQKIDSILENELERAKRYGEELSIMMLDIDHFKYVNDTFGHQTGDSVLVEFSRLMKTNTRKSDVVGRFGGEEFIIICPETSLDSALKVAEKIRDRVAGFEFTQVKHRTVSIGVSSYRVGDEIKDLVKRADEALYVAKEGGRNRVESSASLD